MPDYAAEKHYAIFERGKFCVVVGSGEMRGSLKSAKERYRGQMELQGVTKRDASESLSAFNFSPVVHIPIGRYPDGLAVFMAYSLDQARAIELLDELFVTCRALPNSLVDPVIEAGKNAFAVQLPLYERAQTMADGKPYTGDDLFGSVQYTAFLRDHGVSHEDSLRVSAQVFNIKEGDMGLLF